MLVMKRIYAMRDTCRLPLNPAQKDQKHKNFSFNRVSGTYFDRESLQSKAYVRNQFENNEKQNANVLVKKLPTTHLNKKNIAI